MSDPAMQAFSEAPAADFEAGPLRLDVKVRKWGASLGVVIPANIAEAMHIKEGTPLTLSATSVSLTFSPKPVYPALDDLLASIPEDETTAAYDWGQPRGDEAW